MDKLNVWTTIYACVCVWWYSEQSVTSCKSSVLCYLRWLATNTLNKLLRVFTHTFLFEVKKGKFTQEKIFYSYRKRTIYWRKRAYIIKSVQYHLTINVMNYHSKIDINKLLPMFSLLSMIFHKSQKKYFTAIPMNKPR